jgi:hypothetical protein
MWKLRPQRSIALSAVLARPEVRARLMMAPAAVRPSPQLAAGAPALMAVHRAPLAFAPAAMAVHVTPVALAPAAIAVHLAAAPSVEEIHPRLNLNTRLAFNREIAISAPTASVPSPNFGMSFKYCLVEIERPWLFEPLLHEKSWRVPGYTPGAFATGNADNPAGLMPAMPVAFIAIKDLNISATWTSDDVKSIEDRIGFGPFSLVGSTFVSNTLSCPGVQIIGWICQIMPLLPPT